MAWPAESHLSTTAAPRFLRREKEPLRLILPSTPPRFLRPSGPCCSSESLSSRPCSSSSESAGLAAGAGALFEARRLPRRPNEAARTSAAIGQAGDAARLFAEKARLGVGKLLAR